MVSDSGLAGRVRRAGPLQLSITVRFPLMSEAELHIMRARLRGGLLNAARRGELKVPLPVGLVYDPLSQVAFDPDRQVQHSLRLLFDIFTRTGSARATVKHFRDENLSFPHRPRGGPHRGELHWQPLRFARVLQVLHNPRYAGAFAYRSGRGLPFTPRLVQVVRNNYSLKSRYQRLRDRGLLTVHEAADRLAVSVDTVYEWRKHGFLLGHVHNDRPQYLFEIPDSPPTKQLGRWRSQRKPIFRPAPCRNNRGAV